MIFELFVVTDTTGVYDFTYVWNVGTFIDDMVGKISCSNYLKYLELSSPVNAAPEL